jgi:hypothetical protein
MRTSDSLAMTAASLLLGLAVAGCNTAPSGRLTGPQPTFGVTSTSGFVTTGGAEITITPPDDFTQRWSFVAKHGKGGTAEGEFTWTGKLLGSHVDAHGYIRCFTVSGNRARLGGVITHSNTGLTGEVIWTVEDNGEGSSASGPDQATAFQLGDAETYCLTAPVPDPTTVPVESGNVKVHG